MEMDLSRMMKTVSSLRNQKKAGPFGAAALQWHGDDEC